MNELQYTLLGAFGFPLLILFVWFIVKSIISIFGQSTTQIIFSIIGILAIGVVIGQMAYIYKEL